jgi:polysaccharide export outer membrane protein
LAERVAAEESVASKDDAAALENSSRLASTDLFELWTVLWTRRRLFLSIVGMLLTACLLYCLIAPNVFEATARAALRGTSDSALAIDRGNGPSGSFASGQVQLETQADVFRSDRLAWEVISQLKLYDAKTFSRSFAKKFPGFDPVNPAADAREYLLEAFQKNLIVESIPRTLVLEIRFRSNDGALSAAVVNALIRAEREQDTDTRVEATTNATVWLNKQLFELAAFQKQHEILNGPMKLGDGGPTEIEQTAELTEVDALNREVVNATTDRILREAEYRAAESGDPEVVLASDLRTGSGGNPVSSLLQQLRARRSDLEVEEAQLRIEHGPNFPRVLEIRSEIQDVDRQIQAEDTKLISRFRSSWQIALDRERLLRKNLKEATRLGLKLSEAETSYVTMRQEANANHELYLRLMQQATQAGLAAGSQGSVIFVIDYARTPVKPMAPNLPLYMAITLFVSLWIASGIVMAAERFQKKSAGIVLSLIVFVLMPGIGARAQAPTPSTSGLPTGVARIPQSVESRSAPNAKQAPATWNGEGINAGVPSGAGQMGLPMAAPIGPGDLLEVAEAHTPEMRSAVRVSEAGTVKLPLAGEVSVGAMDERTAAHAIESALVKRGMLLNPEVTVLVTAYTGQDVSVLGAVGRPGVYSFTVHHRLLDLISAASGLNQNAGRLVTITHRNDPMVVVPVVLDLTGTDAGPSHNPELQPGDTVQVSRAGLVYVVGDVVRPGAFPVDPVETTTVVQALSLAWGPGQNAALTKAVLIREQEGGRTMTTLNLKRLLRGLDPDMPIRDRDILFVPDSMAKNLWNRTMESVIQSAAGVSIYAGLVYSQRF